ncbi:MAG: hypothetical protein KDA92_24490, partial [Planctomycetales bacterium]|nr:hypothetical protein [Planctomycetales bacterium]
MDKPTPENPHSFENPTDAATTETVSNSVSTTQVVEEEDVFDPSEYVKDLIARMDVNKSSTATSSAPSSNKPASAPAKESTRKVSEPDASAATPVVSAGSNKVGSTPRPTRAEEIGLNQNGFIDPRRARAAAPQPPVDLEKLREAANITSYSALDVSARHTYVGRAYGDLALALACLANALVMLSLAKGPHTIAYLASIASLIVAGAATARFTRTTRELQIMASRQSSLAETRDGTR